MPCWYTDLFESIESSGAQERQESNSAAAEKFSRDEESTSTAAEPITIEIATFQPQYYQGSPASRAAVEAALREGSIKSFADILAANRALAKQLPNATPHSHSHDHVPTVQERAQWIREKEALLRRKGFPALPAGTVARLFDASNQADPREYSAHLHGPKLLTAGSSDPIIDAIEQRLHDMNANPKEVEAILIAMRQGKGSKTR